MNIKEIISEMGLELDSQQMDVLNRAVEESYVSREEHRAVLADQQFEAMLDSCMTAVGARSPKAVKAMLDLDALKQTPDRESVSNALAALKATDGYLFNGLPNLAYGTGTADPNPRPDPMSAIRRAAMG